MPRCSSTSPCRSSASWLFAAPATTSTRNTLSVSSLITAPSAQGANTAACAPQGIDVRDDQVRPFGVQQLRQMIAYMTASLQSHGLPGEVVRAPAVAGAGLDPAIHAV